MTTYPCPFCAAPADLETGCSGCGRAPFPDAAEVVRLGVRADELLIEVETARGQFDEARNRYDAAVQRLNAVRTQRNLLATRVGQAVQAARLVLRPAPAGGAAGPAPAGQPAGGVPVGYASPGQAGTSQAGTSQVGAAPVGAAQAAAGQAGGVPAGLGQVVPGPIGGVPAGGGPVGGWPGGNGPGGNGPGFGGTGVARPEASPRTVQNLLFILGGLLLGSAAIVFAAVAWASFGVLGRAAILATITVVTLAVPPFALSRGLRSTAETFAALGLLLVLLDGYAAWYVNLAGLADTTRPSTYAGMVSVVTAVVAGGYAVATGLRGPRFAAILVAQPALPLLAAGRSFEATGWTLTFVAVAALDVLLARTVEKAAWVGAGLAVAVAGPLGLLALASVDGVAGALGAGAVMLLLAAVIVAAGLAHRVTAHAGAGIAVAITALVAVRVLAELAPHHQAVVFACVPVLIALAVTVAPARVHAGARVGAIVVACVAAVPYAYAALAGAGSAVGHALPAWHGPMATMDALFSWQVPVALLPITAAFFVITRSRWVLWPAVVLVGFAVPGTFAAPLPVVSVLDFALLATLTVIVLRPASWIRSRPATAPTPAAGAAPAAGPAVGGTAPASGADGPAGAGPAGAGGPATAPAGDGTAGGWQSVDTATPSQPSGVASPSGTTDARTPISTAPGGAGSRAGVAGRADRSGGVWLTAGWWAALALPVVAAHAVLVGLDTPVATLLSMVGFIAMCAVLAARAGTTGTAGAVGGNGVVGAAGVAGAAWMVGPAVAVGLAGVPLLFAAAGRLLGAGAVLSVPGPLLGAVIGLVVATLVVVVPRSRFGAAGVAGVALAGLGVTLAAAGLSAADGGELPFGVFAAAAVLATWFAAAGAGRAQVGQPGGSAARLLQVAAPAVVPAALTVLAVGPAVAGALLRPYRWLGSVWQGAPDGVGLDPDGPWWAGTAQAFRPGPAAVALGLVTVLAVLIARRARTAVWTVAGSTLTMAVVLGCLAAGAPWPAVPAVTLAGGLITALAAALVSPAARPLRSNVGAFTCWFTGGAGLAGCLATKPATLGALAAVLVTGAVIGVAGRTAAARTTGWLVGSIGAGWLAFAAARAAELPMRWTGYWVLLAAAVILGAALAARRLRSAAPREGLVLEVVAHATAVVALLLTTGDAAAMAGISSLWGLALGLRALTGGPRVAFAGVAAAAQLVAYWLVLASNEVALLEAYTLPAGALAAAVGWYATRRRQARDQAQGPVQERGRRPLSSWVAYGPALLAGFAPSLASVLVVEGEPVRRLLLGLGALAVVVAGSVRRLQAPAVVGGSVLVVVALHEVAVYWDLLPRWAPLAVAGLVLVGLATTYERRLRDVRRLRAAVTNMR